MPALLILLVLISWLPTQAVAAPARLERIAGDRQIAVDNVSFTPFSVKVLDESGSPLSHVGVLIGRTTTHQPGPYMEDAFGFRGFNVDIYEIDYLAFGFPPPDGSYGVSDAQGIVTVPATPANGAPAGYVAGAAVLSGAARSSVQTFFSIVRVGTKPPGNPSVIVEYYNALLDHYFNTLLNNEIKLLDAGAFTGWTRSVGAFIGYATLADAPSGAVPVCRFFSSAYTSHFYTADPTECDAVIRRWPDIWTLETREAFYIVPADHSTGTCPAGYQSVFRLYNNRSAPNHRYVTDRALKDTMVAAGWVAEGYGPTATIMCTPA